MRSTRARGPARQFAAGDLSGDGRTKNIAASLVLNFNLFNGGNAPRHSASEIASSRCGASLANQEQEVLRIFADTVALADGSDSYALAVQLKDNATASAAIAEQRSRDGAMNSLDFRKWSCSGCGPHSRRCRRFKHGSQRMWSWTA